jgi:hypothetical protein
MMMMMFIYAQDRVEPIGSYRRSVKPTLVVSKLGSKPSNNNTRSNPQAVLYKRSLFRENCLTYLGTLIHIL